MEIRASMCLSDDEFVALKPQYVSEVLGRLREMAGPYMVAALSW